MDLNFYENLIKNHDDFKVNNLKGLKIKYSSLEKFITEEIPENIVKKTKIGHSAEQKNIYALNLGTGKIKVLFFSQMHGNESCGTRALIDMLSFFTKPNSEHKDFISRLLSSISLTIMPMVNPDGADKFTRHNSFGTDINRDATKLNTAEAKALMKHIDFVKPHYVFSLHDQPLHYAVSNTNLSVAFSFLAPAYDDALSVNESRLKAMNCVNNMCDFLQNIFPGQIAKYSDSYMPNAFGDNIAKKSYASILVETGNIIADPDKEKLRAVQFATLLFALNNIAENKLLENTEIQYNSISKMKSNVYYHFIIRNLKLSQDGVFQNADIAISKEEVGDSSVYLIKEIGDLDAKRGFLEVDAKQKTASQNISLNENGFWLVKQFFDDNYLQV